MAGGTLLSYLLRGPNGEAQSFLEGIFNPAVQYDEITDSILGLLSNDDTNAMRRTSSTMNNGLMARKGNGTFRHRQEVMRDKCDVKGLDPSHRSCQNGIKSSVRLRRCTRGKTEPGFSAKRSSCHRRIKGFLVCTRCHQMALNHPDCQDPEPGRYSHWIVCSACTEREERKYPGGARFCECIAKLQLRVLCFRCLSAKFDYLRREAFKCFDRRSMIWCDVDGQIKFGNVPSKSLVCLGCGTGSSDLARHDLTVQWPTNPEVTRICLFCRNYNIVPSHHPPIPAAIPTVQLPLPKRRSARLNPTETPAIPHTRLSYHGSIRTPNMESQGPQGFSNPSLP